MSNYNKKQEENGKKWWEPALEIFAQITGWIAGPIIIALFLGKYLDDKYQTKPWFFLGLIILAFFITSFGITRITADYIKKIEREAKEKKKNTDNSYQR